MKCAGLLQRRRGTDNKRRRGAVVVLALFVLMAVLAFCAFAVDIGLIATTEAELQHCADGSALSGARGMLESPDTARSRAEYIAESNTAAGDAVEFDTGEDIEFGTWDSVSRQFTAVDAGDEADATAVRITTRRSSARNNALPLFFARIFGKQHTNLSATAVATAMNNFRGFTVPSVDYTLPMLPFTMDEPTWEDVQDNIGPDEWSYNEETGQVENTWDGIPEMNLFPEGNNAPGNRGHLKIGPNGGGNNTLRRQVVQGLNQSDLAHHGGALDLGDDGTLTLGGRPGVIASLNNEFNQVQGELRIIPIFRSVSGNGNNAQYTIVAWVGVRIMYSTFRGNPKQIWVQPAGITIRVGGIPETGDEQRSYEVYSPPKLVQ